MNGCGARKCVLSAEQEDQALSVLRDFRRRHAAFGKIFIAAHSGGLRCSQRIDADRFGKAEEAGQLREPSRGKTEEPDHTLKTGIEIAVGLSVKGTDESVFAVFVSQERKIEGVAVVRDDPSDLLKRLCQTDQHLVFVRLAFGDPGQEGCPAVSFRKGEIHALQYARAPVSAFGGDVQHGVTVRKVRVGMDSFVNILFRNHSLTLAQDRRCCKSNVCACNPCLSEIYSEGTVKKESLCTKNVSILLRMMQKLQE